MTVTADAIREHYDCLANIYRTFWGDHIHHGLFLRGDESPEQAQINLLEYCIEIARVRSGARILDAGCGHGATAVYLASKYGCAVRGITISEKQAQLARENAARSGVQNRTEFIVADADRFSPPQSAFDAVWTVESSEHFFDKAGYIRRAACALVPGGVLLLAAWTGDMRSERVRAVAEVALCPSLQTAGQYQRQFSEANLEVRHFADLTCQVVRTWEICRDRAEKAHALLPLLPHPARQFIAGIQVILDAYRDGGLTYSIFAAQK